MPQQSAISHSYLGCHPARRQAPPEVFERLKEKVLAGAATVAECRQVEQDYRPLLSETKTNRGRPPLGEEGSYQHLGKCRDKTSTAFSNLDEPAFSPIAQGQVAPTIVRSLKNHLADWTAECARMHYPPRHYKDHAEVRINVNGQRRRLDFLAVVRWSLKRPKDLFA